MIKYIINLFKRLFKRKEKVITEKKYIPPVPLKVEKTEQDKNYDNYIQRKRLKRNNRIRIARLSRRINRKKR